MQISNKQVEKYAELYLEEFGVSIDMTHARNELTALVCMLNATHRHINKVTEIHGKD